MIAIVLTMLVVLVLSALVVLYVAFPHRREQLPAAPWLGRAMRRGADSLPTVGDSQDA